jgi:ADP-ribose pyrophosphatase
LWELPAGLLDVPGEPAVRAAQRELHEETHLAAGRWDTLIDLLASPGFTDEALRVFLAREVTVATAARHVAEGEELELAVEWVPLDDAAGRVFAGEIVNAAAVAGILAAARCRDRQWLGLRPADAPWADRPRSAGRVDRPTSA